MYIKSYLLIIITALACSPAATGRIKFNIDNIPKKSLYDTSRWIDSGGPEGADATAFHIDPDGNYWLGTGSSGGVYVSADKGESWIAVNHGIGPVHVLSIGEFKNDLYIQIVAKDRKYPTTI